MKKVSGRPTDVGDCQWIQQLHSVGLLRASFRPPQQVCAVRSRVRERKTLSELASQRDYRPEHVSALQRSLERYQFLLKQMSDLDGEIEEGMEQLIGAPVEATTPIPKASKKLNPGRGSTAEKAEKERQNYCRLFGVDLTQIDGIGLGTLEVVATEVGPDWPRCGSNKIGIKKRRKTACAKWLQRGVSIWFP